MRECLLLSLDHVNHGRSHLRRGPGWELDACGAYFRALNQLANGLDNSLPPPPPLSDRPDEPRRRSEADKHELLVADVRSAELLGDPAVAAFARFHPLVLDHSAPGMSQRIADLTGEVMHMASQQHREFRDSWQRWEERGSGARKALSKLIRSVLVVRNNLAHGEKTPSGPDVQRRERNQAVGRVILPVLDTITDLVLDHPSRRLAVYGTLRPGQPNEDVLTVSGQWTDVTLTGWLRDEAGLPVFESDLSGEQVPAALLTAEDLPMMWRRLDEFEGTNYHRCLGLYQEAGTVGVANVYEWTRGDW